jgi:hypothetical protein
MDPVSSLLRDLPTQVMEHAANQIILLIVIAKVKVIMSAVLQLKAQTVQKF